MRFAHPLWLIAGLLACAALLLLWRVYDRRQQAALARFVSAHLRSELTQSISVPRRRAQRGLYLIGVALLCAALAGPQLGYRWEQISRRGNEIVFAIDTSRSMSTPDVKPDRLSRAKLAIDDFINKLDGDAVGIVAFAGTAFLACPITLDYGAFRETLSAVDTNIIPRGGTNISSAIREAQAALHRRPGGDKILILVTDGEDLEGSALAAAQEAKQQDNLKIFTVGVGTASGDLIPIPADQGGGFVKDEKGEFVKSRLDEAALTAIAAATGGFYVPLGTQGEGLDFIYKTVLGPLAKHDLSSRQQKVYIERFQWPLAASLGFLLMSLLVGTRRRAPRRAAAGGAAVAEAASRGAALLLLALLADRPVRADALSAARAYNHGDFAGAERGYADAAQRDPGKPVLQYNLGDAEYRAGKFPQAIQAFQQSITKSPSSDPKRLTEQEDAYYNLGNALYRAGQKTADSAQQETLQKWTDAVKAYETALQLRADDADAKFNRDLVKRKIDELKQNQNQGQGGQNQDPKQNPQQNQGQGRPQEQPPDQAQGQPPNSPQTTKNDQKPGQPPPGSQQPSDQQSAQNGGQQPPPGENNDAPRKGQASANPESQADEAAREADNAHAPGQMSREEARELLDSVKGDERRMPGPMNTRDSREESQPAKNW